MENTNCELHFKMKNISMKVADAVAYTNPPEATFYCNPIPAGYARVVVDEVVDQYSGLELDIPGGDEERTLGEAIHRIILLRKVMTHKYSQLESGCNGRLLQGDLYKQRCPPPSWICSSF